MARKSKPRSRSGPRRWLRFGGLLLALAAVALGLYAVYLDRVIRSTFEGQRWALPARVFARPLELYAGRPLAAEDLLTELALLGYREGGKGPGTWSRQGARLRVHTRGFRFWDGAEAGQSLDLRFSGNRLASLDSSAGSPIVRLEPVLVGGFYPASNEDRLLVRLEEVPPLLVQALLALEDRDFYSHHGVSPRAVARALWADLRAGGFVQGGSTLTQQLVKNYYLTSDRTLRRKVNEAIMAVLLDLHYGKDEILEAYLNEVFLGQAGARAVHGFAQGSLLYFGRPLQELEIGQMALLAGMVRAPSLYDPRRHPERATRRRDHVLSLLGELGVLDAAAVEHERAQPLGVNPRPAAALSRYPDFLDLVQRQLRVDYPQETLREEGLRIFTTLDPLLQDAAEQALSGKLAAVEKARKLEALQGAVVVADPHAGKVLALVGGREAGFAGFNRALDISRPIGSVVKPAVYLTALAHPERYTLATYVEDAPLDHRLPNGDTWSPQNADRKFLGNITVLRALAQSRNVPTVRIGLDLGVDTVVETLQGLGITRDLPPHPSLLLGALGLSPLEVTQMYATLAAGGFHTPLRGIESVTDAEGEPLTRYPLRTRQGVDRDATYLVTTAMTEVARTGTAARLQQLLPSRVPLAGKTGTSNDTRDAWFAGFGDNLVATVWVGRDDNESTGLYGTSGALPVWAEFARHSPISAYQGTAPGSVEWLQAAAGEGLPHADCASGFGFPILRDSVDAQYLRCGQSATPEPYIPPVSTPRPQTETMIDGIREDVSDWLRKIF